MSSDMDITCTSVIRSMNRVGFSQEEIYDTITGMGVSGNDAQILMDRVKAELESIEFESRIGRLSKEVESIIEVNVEKMMTELNSEIRMLRGKISSAEKSVDRLESRIIELQGICACKLEE